MKKYLLISVAVNIVLTILVVIAVYLLFQFNILPPFQSSFNDYDYTEVDLEQKNIESYAQNLEIPWTVVHIDDSTKLVTERPGRIRLIKGGVLQTEPVLTLDVVARGESGLMGMVMDPDYQNNNYIYINHSYDDEGEMNLKVSRYEFDGENLLNEEVIMDDIPAGNIHASGEMAFGPDGKLYITTGDVGEKELAQDTQSIAGKTLRINKDGSIPDDNPFVDDPDYRDEIWSIGHRNAQGIDWHPITLEMYQSEHGPSGFDGGTGQDEINLVRRGLNYGWPTITGTETQQGLESPLISYTPAIAPASLRFYDGDMFPELQNKILVAALRGTSILVFEVDGEEITEVGSLVDDSYGRIRDISIDDNGAIYFTTSNRDGRGIVRDGDDHIYRISK